MICADTLRNMAQMLGNHCLTKQEFDKRVGQFRVAVEGYIEFQEFRYNSQNTKFDCDDLTYLVKKVEDAKTTKELERAFIQLRECVNAKIIYHSTRMGS